MTAQIVGMDPGSTSGALAGVSDTGDLLWVMDMPTIEKKPAPTLLLSGYRERAADIPVLLTVLENVHSMPKQGVASSFKFGSSKGHLEMLAAVIGAPTEFPSPTAWKKAMVLTRDKDRARSMAVELWPAHADLFARKKDDGRAEAALMAEWGRRLLIERGKIA